MPIDYRGRRIKTLQETPLEGKGVFCRVDFNVPIREGKVTDDTRIRGTLPTLRYLLDRKARVVLASHLGRPKGKPDPKYSLLPVGEHLAGLLKHEVMLPDDCTGSGVKRVLGQQKPEAVVLLENLRFHAEEEKNAEAFARELQNGLDAYVTDAFGALHRAHASVDALARRFPAKAAGFLVEKELKALLPLTEEPTRPFAVILGGAKVSDKIKVMESLLKRVDALLLGGAMVFTFLKALGRKTGASVVEEEALPHAARILEDAKTRGVKVYFPKDFRLGKSVEEPGDPRICDGPDIPDGWMGLDVGPKTVEDFFGALRTAQTIFWNGPLGLFEKPPFDAGTTGVAKLLAELSCTRVIGGGDSAAAVAKGGLAERMTHVSTGGGATLEFLERGGLPGLDALAS